MAGRTIVIAVLAGMLLASVPALALGANDLPPTPGAPSIPNPPPPPLSAGRCVNAVVATYNVAGASGNAMRDVLVVAVGRHGAQGNDVLVIALNQTGPDAAARVSRASFAFNDQLNAGLLGDLVRGPGALGNGTGAGAGMVIQRSGQGAGVLLGVLPDQVTTMNGWAANRSRDAGIATWGQKAARWSDNPIGSTGDIGAFVPAWARTVAAAPAPVQPLVRGVAGFQQGMEGAEAGALLAAGSAQVEAGTVGGHTLGLANLGILTAGDARAEAGTSGTGYQDRAGNATGSILGESLVLAQLAKLGAQNSATAVQGLPARVPSCSA